LRPVRCSRLAVMGRSWWVQLGWIRGICKNSKTVRIQKIMGLYWIILSFFGPGWIDIELYVCTWEYALFLHGLGMVFGGLVWFQTVPWVCTCFLCILDGSEIIHLKWRWRDRERERWNGS
jgi:hypothetical protein